MSGDWLDTTALDYDADGWRELAEQRAETLRKVRAVLDGDYDPHIPGTVDVLREIGWRRLVLDIRRVIDESGEA